jgi:quinol monooxygenase YgiN
MAYVVAATWRAKEGEEDAIAAILARVVPIFRAEPACRQFVAHRSTVDPRTFFLYEQYDDEAAYEAHMASEHFTRLVKEEAIPELLAERRRAFYTTMGDE